MTGPGHSDPLTAEERALAEALARTAPHGQVADPLEAAILEAARAEAATRAGAGGGGAAPHASRAARHRRRPRPGWARGGALAASLVVAVGVAWQLRPQYEAPDLAPPAEVRSAFEGEPMEADHGHRARDAALEPARPPSPLQSRAADRSRPARTAAPAMDAARADPARSPAALPATPAARAPTAPPQASPRPRPAPAPASPPQASPRSRPTPAAPPPPPPAPPAPPAPPPPSAAVAPAAAAKRTGAPEAMVGTPRPTVADVADDTDAGHLHIDQPVDDTPPASLSSPEVRDSWLARIRELVAAGRHDEARRSFAEFHRRHPDDPVPADLRGLLEE